MTRKRAAVVAAGITLSFLLAGCDKADEPAVATAVTGGPVASASATADVVAAYVAGQRKWAACMREQGFDWPDPNAKGQFVFDGDTSRNWKKDPRFAPAQKACEQFSQTVPAELEPKEPPVTAEQLGWRRDFAKCMRENGEPNYPDPDANGNWPQNWGGSGKAVPQEPTADESTGWRAAQICEPVQQGRPKGTYDPNKKAQG